MTEDDKRMEMGDLETSLKKEKVNKKTKEGESKSAVMKEYHTMVADVYERLEGPGIEDAVSAYASLTNFVGENKKLIPRMHKKKGLSQIEEMLDRKYELAKTEVRKYDSK